MAKRNKKQEEPEDPVTKWYGVEPEKPKRKAKAFYPATQTSFVEKVVADLTMEGNWSTTWSGATPNFSTTNFPTTGTYTITMDGNKTYLVHPKQTTEVEAQYNLMKDQWEYISKTTKWEKDEYSAGVKDASGYITSNETPSAEEVEKMYETYHKQKYYSTSIAPTVVSSDQTFTWTTGTIVTNMPAVSYGGGWQYQYPLGQTLPDDQLDFGFEG